MSRSTRSKVKLSGHIRDYSLESRSDMPEEVIGGGTHEGDNDEAIDIKTLLAMLTKSMSMLSESRSSNSNGTGAAPSLQHPPKVDECPIKRTSTSLEAWIDEVSLWNESIRSSDESTRAKKYLKLVDSVRKSENCSDLQNLIEVEFVENQSFDKKGERVIDDILEKVKEKLGQTDIEKCSEAWLEFINIKQEATEAAPSFVIRFEKAETKLRNVKIVIPNKALAIHLMNKSSMEQQSKENVLTKTAVNDDEEIYVSMKKSIREMKGNLTCQESSKDPKASENSTYYTSPTENQSRRSRSRSKLNYRDIKRRSKSKDSRRDRGYESRGRGYKEQRSSSRNGHESSYRGYRDHHSTSRGLQGAEGSYRRSGRRQGSSGSRYSRNRARRSSSEEVNIVHLSEYKGDYDKEFIKDIVDQGEHVIKNIIEIVYNEGTHDINPYRAIIDSGCPKTVAGKPWLDAFIESKGDDIQVKRRKEKEYFRFGPSKVFMSSENYEIEVSIGTLKDKIKVSVVETNVPLLIGLDYQKKWGMIIDIGRNEIHIRKSDETFKISGKESHWTLPIQQESLHARAKNLVFHVDIESLSDLKLRKHIVKVHKNLAHKSEEQLVKLFKMAGKDSKNIKKVIKDVVDTCSICKRFKKTPPRPRVAMPKALSTNEVVSLDLKERRDYKKEILYMCDEFSGFLVAEVIHNKNPETVMKAFNKRWVREGPGIPSKGIFADNGGEFKNPKMKEAAAKYGISLRLTAAHSPWSNGKNERNHYTCDIIVDKLLEEDSTISLEEALSHAVEAKNMQINRTGFSPRQLMFGKQGVVPGITDGNPASMEMVTESDSFRRELVNRQKAEELYRKIDASERIQKCLAQKTYGYSDNKYSEGDKVLFKENDKGRWSGPGKVTGMEGNKVRIIHAGYDRTVPTCRVMPFNDEKDIIEENDERTIDPISVVDDKHEDTHKDIHETNREVRPKLNRKLAFKLNGDEDWRIGKVSAVGKKAGKEKFTCWIKSKGLINKYDFSKEIECWKYITVDFTDKSKQSEVEDTSKTVTEILYTGVSLLKTKDTLENLVDYTGFEIDTVYVTNIPEKYHSDPKVVKAKEDELEKWDQYDAFEEIDDNGQHVLGSRWVVQDRNGKCKARFVVKGCQEDTDPRSDSPTASKDSFKLFISVAANEGFKMKSLDVTSAFLQGYPLERDVYIKPPPERAEQGKVWRLKKSCYGLYDASRKWFLAVQEKLQAMGMKSLSGDDCFFYLIKNEKLVGICLIHVDDFLIAGDKKFLDDTEDALKERFTFGRIEAGKFKFTGLNIKESLEGIFIDQNDYVQSLHPIKIDKLAGKEEKLSKEKFAEFRRLTGQLSWAAENTRPDLSFDARELSTKNKEATYDDLKHANKVLKKAQLEKDVCLKFTKLGKLEDLKVVTYTDSSYRNAENKEKSVGGRLIVLANKKGECNPLLWKSKTIQQVCKSVKTAETRSLERGLEDAIYLARMIQEIYTGKVTENQIPVEVKIDSKTLHDSLHSTKQVDEKTIRHLLSWIKQQIEEKTVQQIDWVCAEDQLADVFTKKNAKTDSILSVIQEGNLLLRSL